MTDNARRLHTFICLALGLVTIAVYSQTLEFDFVNYDDPDYVTENPMVSKGLTWEGIVWAFTKSYAANWHPLTWISHMTDTEIFGMEAGGHHLTSVLFHSFNSILLFLLLFRLTGRTWLSAFVAAVFALHPAHVESVAWISERKDVLCTFFGLSSMLAYVHWTRRRQRRTLVLALLLFAMSLMSKAMWVTLPCLLLLLDFWPLNRLENRGWKTFLTPAFGRLVLEKWPWFLLTLASSWATFHTQKTAGAMAAVQAYSLSFRIGNALTAYWSYIGKLLWPVDLTVFYALLPYRLILPTLAAALGLILVTLLAVAGARNRPYLFTGWFWFVGTLVPVIGLVQVGSQAMADRYTYVPYIGLCVALVWLADDWIRRTTAPRAVVVTVPSVLLAACLILTWRQVGHWENSLTLFSHNLAAVGKNLVNLINLGETHARLGENEKALHYFREAVALDPTRALTRGNLGKILVITGNPVEATNHLAFAMQTETNNADHHVFYANALMKLGRPEEALDYVQTAIRLNPKDAQACSDLGVTLADLGRMDEALTNLFRAVKLNSRYVEGYNNLAGVLVRQKRLSEAMEYYTQALSFGPTNAITHYNLGLTKDKLGQPDEAFAHFQQAVLSNKKHADALFQVGRHFFIRGHFDDALRWLNESLALKPGLAQARLFLGLTLFERGDESMAIGELRNAAETLTNSVEAVNATAWALATANDEQVRNGTEAIVWSRRAAEITQRKQPAVLRTLAAACAADQKFDEAVKTAQEAIALAQSQGQTGLSEMLRQDLERYQKREMLRHEVQPPR